MKINEDTQRLMEALPLFSAWGLAIEAGQDSSEQYVELMRLHCIANFRVLLMPLF